MARYSRAHFGLMAFVTGPKKRTCVLTQSQQIQWPLDQDLLPGPNGQKNLGQSRRARLPGANAPDDWQAKPLPVAGVPVPWGERQAYIRSLENSP